MPSLRCQLKNVRGNLAKWKLVTRLLIEQQMATATPEEREAEAVRLFKLASEMIAKTAIEKRRRWSRQWRPGQVMRRIAGRHDIDIQET